MSCNNVNGMSMACQFYFHDKHSSSVLGSADRSSARCTQIRYEKTEWARLKLYGLRISPDNFFLRGLVLNFPTIYTFTYLRCLDCVHLFVFVLPIDSNYEKRYQIIAQPQWKCLVLKRKFCISCPSALSILFHSKYTHTIWISKPNSQYSWRYSDFVFSTIGWSIESPSNC